MELFNRDEALSLMADDELSKLFKILFARIGIFQNETKEELRDLHVQLLTASADYRRTETDNRDSLINYDERRKSLVKTRKSVAEAILDLPHSFWDFVAAKNTKDEVIKIEIDLNQGGNATKTVNPVKQNKQIRDYSVYIFNEQHYSKGKLVNAVLREYVNQHPTLTYNNLELVFPKSIQGTYGVFSTIENAEKVNVNKIKYNTKPLYLIDLKDCQIATCIHWGLGEKPNFPNFLEKVKSLGFRIEILEN